MKKNRLLFVAIVTLVFITIFILILPNKKKADLIEDKKLPKVGLVLKTITSPFFIELEKGVRDAAEKMNYELLIQYGNIDTASSSQVIAVKKLINEEVEGIIVSPIDVYTLIPLIRKAQKKGIKIVCVDSRFDEILCEKYNVCDIAYITIDNEAAAYDVAKTVLKDIKSPTNVVIIEGIINSNTNKERKQGYLRACNELSNVKIIHSQSANWMLKEAKDLIDDIFHHYAKIDVIISANDMMALGISEYLEENNINNVKVIGFDAIDDIKPLLRDGPMSATVYQNQYQMGYQSLQELHNLILNREAKSRNVKYEIITKETIQD